MRSELICIGTELLTGKLNTNSSFIGERLSGLGLDLSYITTVGDDTARLELAFRDAVSRSNIIIATGGLGPTFDDLTREAAAKVLNKPLVLNGEVLEGIRRYFEQRNTSMPKSNERQAYFIEGAKVLKNPVGTAPGQILETFKGDGKSANDRLIIILLPGPPREMQAMFDQLVYPYLKSFERKIKKAFTLHVCGMSESAVDEKIRPVVEAERRLDAGYVDFTILAHQIIIDVKVSAYGKNEMHVDETLANIKHEFYEILGSNIYGEDKQTLEGVVGELLMSTNSKLAVAESCTGGLLAQKITNVPGSSMYFKQGAVTYANESKVTMLGVKDGTLASFGAVSEQTALEMADGMKKTAGTDYAVSVTGIAGPGGGTPEKPVGLVYIGIAGPRIRQAFRFVFGGHRSDIRERAANRALDILRRQLLDDKGQVARVQGQGKSKS